MNIKTKLLGGFVCVAAVVVLVGGIGVWGINQMGKSLVEIGEVRISSVGSLATIKESQAMIVVQQLYLNNRRDFADIEHRKLCFSTVENELKDIQSAQGIYDSLPKMKEEGQLWAQCAPVFEQWKRALANYMAVARSKEAFVNKTYAGKSYAEWNEDPAVAELDNNVVEALGKTRELRRESAALLAKLVEMNTTEAGVATASGMETADSLRIVNVVGMIGGFALALILGIPLSISIAGALKKITKTAESIAQGDLSVAFDCTTKDEIGILNRAMSGMVKAIGALVADAELLSKAAVRGELSTRADAGKHQGDFRKIVQGVDDCLDAVIGPLKVAAGYVERISKGDIPPKITDEYRGDFNILKNNLNDCIVAVNLLVADADMLSKGAVRGELSTRADAGKHQGDFRKIVQGVDDCLDAVVGPLKVAAGYVERISKGDIPPKITDEYRGDFNVLKNNLNHCITAVNLLVEDADTLCEAAVCGALSTRADAGKHQGDFRKIVQGVNDCLDAVIGPLNVAAGYVERIAKGDIPPKITAEYSGDFNILKNNLNDCVLSLELLVSAAREMASGNWAIEIQPRSDQDELLKANATMIAEINHVLGEIQEAVMQVNSGAEQISDASQSLSQGATEQASSLEEITSSVTEIAAQTKTNAENANQANSLADSVRKASETGSAQMTQMVESMNSIDASSKQIAKIIKVIDDIAFQTNLLALNAAVEAARAGRHGKGFAVVADEVRNLAGRSAKAAKETAELIESSGAKTSAGMQVATSTAESFKEILSGIVKTNDLVGEIASASSEQAQGVSQINIGLSQVDQVTQQNTANAEETASAAEELSSQATHLQGLVAKFKLRGGNRQQAALPPSGGASKQQARGLPAKQAKPRSAAPKSGWGDRAAKPAANEDIINLDDREFGKY